MPNVVAVADGVMLKIISNSTAMFTTSSACVYEVQYPSNAVGGDMIYLQFNILKKVQISVYIASAPNATSITQCKAYQGDSLIANFPNKFYISIESTAAQSSYG